ncbi:DUF4180 domain-containing protein [Actinomadura barringtoniae]|uniref:DUF4180 domain-containing protein n=1 Tax=Actinomadura barringtoniae TaxID=1427535 RepID=UPI0027DD5400|nr:DUF4180 domain-containing protein [Actinomadura barringtoniae]
MADVFEELGGVLVLVCSADGETVGERDATQLIADASYPEPARWVAVPVERLDQAFFQLSSRVAGEIVQKFVTYRMGLAIVGDISRYAEGSKALRDFVRECNRGTQTWFVDDLDALKARLAV